VYDFQFVWTDEDEDDDDDDDNKNQTAMQVLLVHYHPGESLLTCVMMHFV
jgi:hypothetical protein